jgi:putative ABC transport system permease protein
MLALFMAKALKVSRNMLRNYFKLAFRTLQKQKFQSLLNLGGLGIGLACCLLIALYIAGEMRYDRHHGKAERIWRVTRTFLNQDGSVDLNLSAIAPPFGSLLPQHFPEIEKITRTLPFNGTLRTANQKMFQEQNIFFADEQLPAIFDLPMKRGDAAAALAEPWQALMSESSAKRYFGDRDPLGEVLNVDNQFRLKVAGVYRDFPAASHWHPDLLFSFSSLRDSAAYGERNLQTNFGNNAFYTYMLVGQNFEPEKMAARIPKFLDDVFPPPPPGSGVTQKPHEFTQLNLQKLTDIHLLSHHDDEIEPGGDLARVRLFGVIALVILLIAGINYVNLSTAFSLARAREIGVRKSAGAFRSQVITQFLAESLLLTFGAAVLAYGLAAAALPLLKTALGVEISRGLLLNWQVPAALLAAAVLTGLLAGLYPAFFMSGFNPVTALKGAATVGRGSASLRKGLVVAQFGVTAALLVGTGVIYRQLRYMQNKSLGYDRAQIVNLVANQGLNAKWETLRSELLANPAVLNITRSSRLPSGRLLDDLGGTSVQMGDTMAKLSVTLKMLAVDLDFAQTYQIPLAAGRAFSRDFMNDTTHSWLLNEAAVRAVGWRSAEEAIGKRLIYGGRQDCYVAGVLKDFHFESLHQEILPMIFFIPRQNNFLSSISIKLGPNTAAGLAHAEQVWKKFSPEFPFDYTFLDENFGRLYETEMRQGQLFMLFSGLAVFIACLGLLGLAAFAAHRRTKEIGVRKVLGASVASVVGLLSKDFLWLVLIALALAAPVAWWTMSRWLADFAYRIDIGWEVFVGAGAVAIAAAFFTVATQALRAALANPVKSLRSE